MVRPIRDLRLFLSYIYSKHECGTEKSRAGHADFCHGLQGSICHPFIQGNGIQRLKRVYAAYFLWKRGNAFYEEENIALLAVGSMVENYGRTCKREKLKEEGYSCTLANARFVKPFDKELVERLAKNHRLIVTMEENVPREVWTPVTAYIHEHYPQVKVLNIALPDAYVEHGNVSVLRGRTGNRQ